MTTELLLLLKSVNGFASKWNNRSDMCVGGSPRPSRRSAHRSSDSGTAGSSGASVVITMGMFSDIHPLGVLLKDRLPESGLAKAMNLESVRSSSSKSGTLNFTIFDAFSKPPNGVATLWGMKRKRIN